MTEEIETIDRFRASYDSVLNVSLFTTSVEASVALPNRNDAIVIIELIRFMSHLLLRCLDRAHLSIQNSAASNTSINAHGAVAITALEKNSFK